MKRLLILTVVFVFILAGANSLQAAKNKRATIAILPFIVDETIRVSIGGQTLIPTVLETEFTSEITEFLVKSRKFDVLERDHIRKILSEYKITESEYAAPSEIKRIGGLLSADYLVIGYMDRLAFQRKVTNIELTGERAENWIGTLKVHFRIVRSKTGKIVFAQQLKRKLKTRDLKRTMTYEERRDMTLGDFKDILFKRVSEIAGNLILAGIYPIKVASVNGDDIMLNRGQGAGIKKGGRYRVYNMGEAVTDPDTGESLGAEEIKAGEIVVTSVHAKFSKAKPVKTESDIKPGSICRLIVEEEREAAKPEVPRATPGW